MSLAETIEQIRRSNPAAVAEYEAAEIEVKKYAQLFAGCIQAHDERLIGAAARQLRGNVLRVSLRWARARAAMVVAERTACKLVEL